MKWNSYSKYPINGEAPCWASTPFGIYKVSAMHGYGLKWQADTPIGFPNPISKAGIETAAEAKRILELDYKERLEESKKC